MRMVLPGASLNCAEEQGLPWHRIVLDEAHYFLQDPESRKLLDLNLGGYTLVTYRASDLCESALKASQAILVTRESDPEAIQSLRGLCQDLFPSDRTAAQWNELFQNLVVGEAAAASHYRRGARGGSPLPPRATIDSPCASSIEVHRYPHIGNPSFCLRARQFSGGSQGAAMTLREFVAVIEHSRVSDLDGHFRHKDFSRWIVGVFGDYQLGSAVSDLEEDYALGNREQIIANLVREIRFRYDFIQDDAEPQSNAATAAHSGRS